MQGGSTFWTILQSALSGPGSDKRCINAVDFPVRLGLLLTGRLMQTLWGLNPRPFSWGSSRTTNLLPILLSPMNGPCKRVCVQHLLELMHHGLLARGSTTAHHGIVASTFLLIVFLPSLCVDRKHCKRLTTENTYFVWC